MRKSIRPAKTLSDEMLAWLSVWSKVQMIHYGPADATATPSSLASLKSRIVSFFLVLAYQGCCGKDAVFFLDYIISCFRSLYSFS